MPYNFNWGVPPLASPEMLGTGVSAAGLSSYGSPMPAVPGAVATVPGSVPPVAGAGGIGQTMFGGGLGWNMDTARLALSGLGTIGSLYGALQASNLAKKQFSYTRDVTETNLANQLKSYNTQLTDRANNRAIVEGRSAAETAAYIDTNKMTRYGRS